MSRIANKEPVEGELIPQPQDLCFVESSLQLALREHGGEVEEGARDCGDGDAGVGGDLVGSQSCLVYLDSRARAASVRDSDLARAPLADDLPMGPRRAVAQDGPGAVGEYRRHPTGLPWKLPLAHGIDSAMKRVEAPEQ
jgi:hypothetical protein